MNQDLFSFAESLASDAQSDILSVSEFLASVNVMFAEIGVVKIKGEIEDIGLRGSYAFFALKESDQGGQVLAGVDCFVGWNVLPRVKHLLESGMEVVIKGTPKVYPKNGKFSVDITNIEPVGAGALQKAFEALKQKLGAKGYFDADRKRQLPLFVKNIGIVTSMSGAAVIDFQRNLGNHGFHIEYIDVRVEGEYAEEHIIAAIKKLNELRPNLDALVVMRGGGSLESLKAFNSERVADAIYFSRIPVITGIGHEKDDTIADYVADVRCSTPTAVAVFLRSQREELLSRIENITSELVYSFDGVFHEFDLNINHQKQKLIRNFEYILENAHLQIESAEQKLQSGFQSIFHLFHSLEMKFENAVSEIDYKFRLHSQATDLLEQKLVMSFQDFVMHENTLVNNFEKQLNALNPESVLKRGYSIVTNEKGKTLRKISDFSPQEKIRVRVSDGEVEAKVEETKTAKK